MHVRATFCRVPINHMKNCSLKGISCKALHGVENHRQRLPWLARSIVSYPHLIISHPSLTCSACVWLEGAVLHGRVEIHRRADSIASCRSLGSANFANSACFELWSVPLARWASFLGSWGSLVRNVLVLKAGVTVALVGCRANVQMGVSRTIRLFSNKRKHEAASSRCRDVGAYLQCLVLPSCYESNSWFCSKMAALAQSRSGHRLGPHA